MRASEPEPEHDPESDSHESEAGGIDDSVFDLEPPPLEPVPREPPDLVAEPMVSEPMEEPEEPYRPQPSGRGVHSIGITDLSRLAIDNEGRLYWDGKPVEVRRRVTMSRAQMVGAVIITLFVVIGGVGAAIHGSAAALDWACRLGWTTHYCVSPDNAPARADIPA
jgi:hypothetical protein